MKKMFLKENLYVVILSLCVWQSAWAASSTSETTLSSVHSSNNDQQPISPVPTLPNVSYLPAGYDVIVTPLDGITSKGHEVGNTFSIKTTYDVLYHGYIIIPHGTLGQARISWRTGKGVFGKSAKIELTFDWLDLNGRRIALGGTYRQNGQGNTGATVATTVGVGIATLGVGLLVGGAITGKSANIQPGVQMTAHTMEALPIALPINAQADAIQALEPVQTTAMSPTSGPLPSSNPPVSQTSSTAGSSAGTSNP